MKIGMMVDAYQSHLSGVTNHVTILKHYFEQQGHPVFVFSFGKTAQAGLEDRNIVSWGLPLTQTYYWGWRYNTPAVKLLQTMDVVHIHHPFLSGRLALRYCKPHGIPLVFTNHTRYDLYMHYYLPWLPESLGQLFLHRYMPRYCRLMDQVIAPSASVEKVLRKWGVDRPIEVIPNGVAVQRFHGGKAASLRARFGLAVENLVFIFVGRLSGEKNLQFLLHSFTPLARAHANARLVLVGDGSERGLLQRRAASAGISAQVIFTGKVDYQDLPEHLRMGDVFVTASVTEVHPLTVIEAMAAGLPVVGIRSPGMVDTVVDGVTGLLSEDNPEAFTACLEQMLNPSMRGAMAKEAAARAQAYALENTAGKILRLYQKMIEDKSAKREPEEMGRAGVR